MRGWSLAFCVLVKCESGPTFCDEGQLLISMWHTGAEELNGAAMPLLVRIYLVFVVGGG